MKPLNTPSSGHWAAANEVTFITGMKFMFAVCRLFGRWPFRFILYPVLIWYVVANSVARQSSRNYLRHVGRFEPISSNIFMVIRHFASFAESMLDKMLLWSGALDISRIRVFGRQQMDQLLEQKKGALLVCAHLGNLDLCRALSTKNSVLKLNVLVHTKHAQRFNELLSKLNPASQLNLIQVTEMTPATAMLLAQKIAQGEFIVIAGDRVPVTNNSRVEQASFLGELAPFPVGPYVLAGILQCPTYMLFCKRQKDAKGWHHEIHFEFLRESFHLPRKGREQLLKELVVTYAARLQAHCLSAPLEWFNFYDYWHLPELELSDATS